MLLEKEKFAQNEQFLFLPQCFQNTCSADIKTRAFLGNNSLYNRILSLSLRKHLQTIEYESPKFSSFPTLFSF